MPDRDRREELQDGVERAVLNKGEAATLPNPHEIMAVAGFAAELPSKAEGWQLTWATSLTCAPGESWLHIAFAPKMPYPADAKGVGPIDLCLWRFSLEVYPLLEDGSVPDDPITPEQFGERFR